MKTFGYLFRSDMIIHELTEMPINLLMADKKSNSSVKEALPFIIPEWVYWIAQDESGVWWGYSVEPLRNDHGWYENELGKYLPLGETETTNWTESLSRVNND
jgi:hypothetical protein